MELLFGYGRNELLGKPVEILVPERFRRAHPSYRKLFHETPRARPMGDNLELFGLRKDGREFPVAISLSPLETEEGTVVVSVIRDITTRRRNEQSLRQLSVEVLRAQDEERRRIARELHDSAGQHLTAAKMHIETLMKESRLISESASRRLSDAAEALDVCMKEIRTMSYLLHPPLLEDLGLSSAVRWYVDGFSSRSGISVQLDMPHDLGRLGAETELVLFRVLQESLTNVHRHSGSETAKVHLGTDGRTIWLEVHDQGRNLANASGAVDTAQVTRVGVGISGMRERVRHLGGALNVESDQRGTRVRAVLPVQKPELPSRV